MITIGVDSHKRTHTVVAVDDNGRRLAEKTLATTPAGHLEMDMPSLVYLGVAAVNTTQAPFAATFEDFTVSPAP